MRARLDNMWAGGEEEQLVAILKDFLRTPGNHPALAAWYQLAQGEPLAVLYDLWTEAKKMPDQAYAYVQMFMEQYNVLVGRDMAGEVAGAELFYNDLTELCNAVDVWLSAGQVDQTQGGTAMAAADFYRSVGGFNPGAVNILRGWYELHQVILGRKRIIRCTAADCSKLLVINPENDLLSGTDDGYHSTSCKEAHTPGAQDTELQLKQLPGSGELQDAVGPIVEGTDVDTPEAS